jgi:hypothetical protein
MHERHVTKLISSEIPREAYQCHPTIYCQMSPPLESFSSLSQQRAIIRRSNKSDVASTAMIKKAKAERAAEMRVDETEEG